MAVLVLCSSCRSDRALFTSDCSFCSCVLGVWDILKHQVVDRSWARMGGAEVIFIEEKGEHGLSLLIVLQA